MKGPLRERNGPSGPFGSGVTAVGVAWWRRDYSKAP